jgi:hypothetical protein
MKAIHPIMQTKELLGRVYFKASQGHVTFFTSTDGMSPRVRADLQCWKSLSPSGVEHWWWYGWIHYNCSS